MFNIVLVQPEIPPNTGNIIRLAANTGCKLHLVEPLGFNLQDKHMRRAGLDYHEYACIKRHHSWSDFCANEQPNIKRLFALTTKGKHSPYQVQFNPDDWLVFGAETRGLPSQVREQIPLQNWLRLPMRENQRSLNLSNSVAICIYEAWRQNDFN